MTLFLAVGLVAIAGIMSLLTGAGDLFSGIFSMPDSATIAELERKARAAGR